MKEMKIDVAMRDVPQVHASSIAAIESLMLSPLKSHVIERGWGDG